MRIDNSVRFTKKELETVSQELTKELENIQLLAENEIIKENMSFIKASAQRYIIFMQTALKYIEQFEFVLKEMYKIRHIKIQPKKIQILYKRYERQKSKFLASSLSIKILQETERFQQALSNFLGQTLKTVYSFDGKLYDISNIPIERIVSADYSSSNKFRGVYNFSNIKSIIKNESVLAPELEFDETVTPIYKEAMRRYQATKNQVIFWREKGTTAVQKVQSKGSIEEAYANLAINRTVKFSNGGWTEADIGVFVKQGIMQVDNASGRLKGDFAINEIEYAVKSLNATMVGIKQFIALAEAVLMEDFNIDKLQQIKTEDEKRGKSINAFSTELTEEINNLIEQYFSINK